jgi:hypothetical protein
MMTEKKRKNLDTRPVPATRFLNLWLLHMFTTFR